MRRIIASLSAFKIYLKPHIYVCGLLSFSSGFSVLFILSTIPVWFKDFGVSKTVIGWFALAYAPYVLKILWAPFVSVTEAPIFGKWLGHLRGWAFLMQLAVIASIIVLSFISPIDHIILAWIVIFFISFFSATRDIVTDAYRVEILKPEEVAPGSAVYHLGYRLGMLTSSAGGLILADYLPWNVVFYILSFLLFIGLVTILFIPEPVIEHQLVKTGCKDSSWSWFQIMRNKLSIATVEPFKEFMKRDSWILLLLIIPFFKLGDNFVQHMSNLFFLEVGFTKTDIASAVKIFGLLASILGSILGGVIVNKTGDLKTLLICGFIHLLSFSTFVGQAIIGDNIFMLYFTIGVTSITAGIVTTAFVSYISNLCHPYYKSTQYALFSSLRSLDKCLTFPAGWLADHMVWSVYFAVTPLFGLPALLLLGYVIVMRGSRYKAAPNTVKDTVSNP